MAIQTGGRGRMLSEINVTPFVDVMLVLLIIFMVAAPMMTQGVTVDLPEVNAPPVDAEQEPLVVSITIDGDVFINDINVGLDGLEEKLISINTNQQGAMQVLLRADQNINYGLVVKAMAAIKAAGVTDLGMVTNPEPVVKPQ